MSEDLRFPIGKFDKNIEVTPELRKSVYSDDYGFAEKFARSG